MNQTDNDIKAALHKADRDDFGDLAQDMTLREMMASTFRGRQRWMTFVAWFDMFAFTAVAVIAAVMFFRSDAVRDLIMWATIFLTCASIIMIAKMWYWMAMNRNAVGREIKRLEFRIADLADKVEAK